MPRLFVAIELPPSTRSALAAIQASLQGDSGVRWVRPETLHLTLRFLGETAADRVPVLVARLGDVARQHSPFELRVAGGGRFPKRGKPRVLWAGVSGDLAALHALVADLESAVVSLGFSAADDPYHPHITLGRVKRGRAEGSVAALAALGAVGPLPADHLVLFESTTGSGGVRHTPLAHPTLGD